MPDYPKAAEKNLADAAVLLEKGRWDGAAYHAGFAVECILNAFLGSARVPPPKEHGLSKLEDLVNALAAAGKCKSLAQSHSGILQVNRLYRWNPIQIRYSSEFIHDKPTAENWVRGARQFCQKVKP